MKICRVNIIEKVEELRTVVDIRKTSISFNKRDVGKVLDAKDSNYISDNTYAILRKELNLRSELPPLYSVRKHAKNSNLYQINTNSKGVFVSIKEKLKYSIIQLYEKKIINTIENKTLTIKLCADGTNVSRKASIYILSFSIIDQKNTCQTAFGHYLIGIFDISENYEDLKIALKEIVEELNNLTMIEIDVENTKKDFNINTKFSSDLKATSMLMGVNMANANYPCPFCKFRFLGKKSVTIKDVEIYVESLKKSYDLEDNDICRTQSESKRLISKNSSEERKGNSNNRNKIFYKSNF